MSVFISVHEHGLTDDDIRLIDRIAGTMIEANSWKRVVYRPSDIMDLVEVYHVDFSDPVHGIGRHLNGLYMVADYRSGQVTLGTALIVAIRQQARINADFLPERRALFFLAH